MRRSWLLLLASWGCAPAPSAPPPSPFDVLSDAALPVLQSPASPIGVVPRGAAVRGELLEIDITLPVARGGLSLFVPVVDEGLGSGICPPPLGGECLEVVGNLDLQQVTTTPAGTAVLSYVVPETHATDVLALQVVVPTSNRVFLSDPLVLDVGGSWDADEDGVPAEEDCDDSDAGLGDVALDGDCDGVPTSADCDDTNFLLPAFDQDCDGAWTQADCDDLDPYSTHRIFDGDCDGVWTVEDCDDSDETVLSRADDQDCDGFLTAEDCDDLSAASTVVSEDGDCDGVLTAADCDDDSALLGDASADLDCDGILTAEDCNDLVATMPLLDGDCDGVLTSEDCDDSVAALGSVSADGDCDGILTAADCDDDSALLGAVSADADCDGILTGEDCNDDDPDATSVMADSDCDGILTAEDCDDGSALLGSVSADADCDGILTAEDCDDANASLPLLDGDCDGVLTAADCDDADPSSTHRAFDADCDGLWTNEDCNDDDVTALAIAEDQDCDGTATAEDCDDTDPLSTWVATDEDCDGFLTAEDCDDTRETVYPGAPEVCDSVDNNCDTLVDDDDPLLDVSTQTTFYEDWDADGYGDDDVTVDACTMPLGFADIGTDCDDDDELVSPGGRDTLLVDRTCDGVIEKTVDHADVVIRGASILGSAWSSTTNVGDLDGDDVADIVFGSWSGGRLYVHSGASLNPGSTSIEDDAWLALRGDAASRFGTVVTAGDVDGDDLTDLLVSAHMSEDERGHAYLFLGTTLQAHDTLDVADADYRFVGENPGDRFGGRIAMGDVDGDGRDDLLVAAERFGERAGKVYVVLASQLGAPGEILASNADHSFVGEAENDRLFNVASGDMDGDGLDEVVMGAWRNADGGDFAGKVYVVRGSTLASQASGDLTQADLVVQGTFLNQLGRTFNVASDLDGDGRADLLIEPLADFDALDAVVVSGTTLDTRSELTLLEADYRFLVDGRSVNFVGDLDGDGRGDIGIADRYDSTGGDNAGAVWVYSAATLAPGEIDLTAVDFALYGEAGQYFGAGLKQIGDVDDDGLDDMLVGASGTYDQFSNFSGTSFVISGAGLDSTGSASSVVAEFSPEPSTYLKALDVIGDVDGDGRDDLLAAGRMGEAYVFLGAALDDSALTIDDAAYVISPSNGEAVASNGLSYHLSGSGAGDVDGDGLADFMLGASYADHIGEDAGAVYLFLGGSLGADRQLTLDQADHTFLGETAHHRAGTAMCSGDIDGDGYSDLLMAAFFTRQVYLFYGSTLAGAELSLADADVTFTDGASWFGRGLSCAGDVDGDARDDVLIGAPYVLDAGQHVGGAFLFLSQTVVSSTALTGADADHQFLGQPDSLTGSSVSIGGDVDGDGLDDVLISASHEDRVDTNAGAAHLFYANRLTWPGTTSTDSADHSFWGEAGASTHPYGGDFTGDIVRIIPDMDGDTLDDILVGANYAYEFPVSGAHSGRFYLLPASGLGADPDVPLADVPYRFTYDGARNLTAGFGGDLNGDGLGDFVGFASDPNHGRGGSGAIYVAWGTP